MSAPVRCVLEMTEDAHIAIIVKAGCSIADVHDVLRMLALSGGQFGHLTFVDEDEDLP